MPGKKLTVKDYNEVVAKFEDLNTRVEAAEKKAADAEEKSQSYLAGNIPTIQTSSRGMNNDENKALSYFGCGHVKDLLNVNTGDPRFDWVPREIKGYVVALKNDFDTARVIGQMFYGDSLDKIGKTEKQDRVANCKGMMESYFYKNVLGQKLKAFDTVTNADWVPTVLASTYISELELAREFVGMLKQIAMPQSPYELPTNGFSVARGGQEGATATKGSFNTGKLNFQAKKFLEYYEFTEEINEESAPGIVALGRMELTNAHLRAYEQCLINGDIAGVHQDADSQAGAADLAEKQFDGIRKICAANSAFGTLVDFAGAVVGDAGLQLMRSQMGKFGVMPQDLVWVAGAKSYLQMIKTANVTTVDKMGPNATILKGQLGSYDGIPIVQSGFMKQNLDTSGFNILPGDSQTGILLVHRPRLYWGTRRPIRMALRPSRSADDQLEMASYSRVDFEMDTSDFSTGNTPMVYGHGIL